MSGKSALGSLTIVSAAVALIAQLVNLVWGVTIAPEDQARLIEVGNQTVALISTGATIIGALGAIWGRMRARRPITSALPRRP